jgi:hypothetical protein
MGCRGPSTNGREVLASAWTTSPRKSSVASMGVSVSPPAPPTRLMTGVRTLLGSRNHTDVEISSSL